MLPLLIALQFLTRLPVRLSRLPTAQENGQSLLWYPLVGLLIGALLLGVHLMLGSTPALLQAALLLSLWVWLSGGLHLDGLADTADAWVGGHGDRERTLTIMKDPASGPMGVLALVLVLLLKFAALASLLSADAWIALLLAPWMGRWLLPLLLLTTAYVRPAGLGQDLARYLPRRLLPWILLLHGLAMLLLGWVALMSLVAVLLLTLYWRGVLLRRLGGTTGDTAGALLELGECLVLLVIALMLA